MIRQRYPEVGDIVSLRDASPADAIGQVSSSDGDALSVLWRDGRTTIERLSANLELFDCDCSVAFEIANGARGRCGAWGWIEAPRSHQNPDWLPVNPAPCPACPCVYLHCARVRIYGTRIEAASLRCCNDHAVRVVFPFRHPPLFNVSDVPGVQKRIDEFAEYVDYGLLILSPEEIT